MATHETTSDPATAGEPGPVVKTSPVEGGTKHEHPSDKQYVMVALILAAITLAEVLVYYIESLEGLLVPILAVMSILKLALVVLWFMHLRFDSRLFRRLFFTGVALAVFVYVAYLSTLHVWTR
ncbi:MAG: cytochrome C oxidase subunit IV family protein [Actinomycetota bacterium]|nr:cytochrome C oxidase subunit IV family protein [Actinomycetota bacterium]